MNSYLGSALLLVLTVATGAVGCSQKPSKPSAASGPESNAAVGAHLKVTPRETPGDSSACAELNGGADCSPTEQRFVDKSVECYQCMVNGGCLDDVKFGDTGHECSDLTGNAERGARTGAPRSTLCLETLDCVLDPAKKCAAADVNLCYCGSLGAGNGCATAASGADGACLQQEIDGLEHLASDAPSTVLVDYTALGLGSGIANQLFVCAKSNGCDTLCSM